MPVYRDGAALPRVAPPRITASATRSARPPLESAGSADAYRQATFVLGKEIELLLRGFALEGAIAEASAGAKYRTQQAAAGLGLWSRAWLTRLQAMHALEWGSYVAAMPLVRAAADYQASGLYVLRDEAQEWTAWLQSGGIAIAPQEHATELQLHAFRAAEVLAAHAILGPIYRASTDLSLPHFGSTLLLAGSDSDPERVLITFGDRDFHLGLAQVVSGWLLLLGVAQLEAALEFATVFAIPESQAVAAFCADARSVAADPDRCRVEVIERDGEKRYLIHNWRRAAGGAPKRILL
ncbi:MAG: hypothetical protein ABIP13_05930 [Tepidiformaceae bacterium]